jgi:hypothetical protein
MPKTYEPIGTYTVSTAVSTYTFTSIPATYTDLIIAASVQRTASPANTLVRINGDSGANYYNSFLFADGTAWGSSGQNAQAQMQMDSRAYAPSSGFGSNIMQFMNYTNTSVNKTVISRADATTTGTEMWVNMWLNTAAITSIELFITGGNFATGSTFTLYGIKAA